MWGWCCSSRKKGCAITQCTGRALSAVHWQRPVEYLLDFFLHFGVHHLTPEILVELLGRNEEQLCFLRTYVACILLDVVHICSSSLFLHQIKFIVRAYMLVDGWVDIVLRENCPPCKGFATWKHPKAMVPLCLIDQELSSLLPSFYCLRFILSGGSKPQTRAKVLFPSHGPLFSCFP